MPTLLDDVLEMHDGPEPRVPVKDVQAVLRRKVRPEDKDSGTAVTSIAEDAGVSTRTVYRVLNPDDEKADIGLDLADRLCMACGVHMRTYCRLVWPDGTLTDYVV